VTGRTRARTWAGAPLIALALVGASCGGSATSTAQLAPATHPALFYDDATFFASVSAAAALPLPEDDVAGAIIPHDWRGGVYIAWLFRSMAERDPPATVILIGPNHDNEGFRGVLTSELAWSTRFGAVQPDRQLIDVLIREGLISVDEPVLGTEHSVAGIMPAIAYYLPGARVVPLIIRGDAGPDDAERIGRALASRLDGATLLVAAVDFSHDLISSAAQHNNAVTLTALRAGDSAMLFTLDNRYLDSPESIAVLMASMASVGAGPFVLTADTNSAALRGDELAPTTSYLVGYYTAALAQAAVPYGQDNTHEPIQAGALRGLGSAVPDLAGGNRAYRNEVRTIRPARPPLVLSSPE
jgi:AmmeMemoRadiSam system protein B